MMEVAGSDSVSTAYSEPHTRAPNVRMPDVGMSNAGIYVQRTT